LKVFYYEKNVNLNSQPAQQHIATRFESTHQQSPQPNAFGIYGGTFGSGIPQSVVYHKTVVPAQISYVSPTTYHTEVFGQPTLDYCLKLFLFTHSGYSHSLVFFYFSYQFVYLPSIFYYHYHPILNIIDIGKIYQTSFNVSRKRNQPS
jgi:hypothetical protein